TTALARDRDQLWAEAMQRYRAGATWYLDPAMAAQAATIQEQYMEHDPWEEKVLEHVAPLLNARPPGTDVHVTTRDIMREPFGWETPAMWTQPHTKRIGGILRRQGWISERPRGRDGKVYAAFRAPREAPTPPGPPQRPGA